jgi:transposase
MSKYTKQFKLTVVKHYLMGTAGLKPVAKCYGLAHSVVARWVAMYRLRGADGLDKKFSHYTAQFKLSVLQHMWQHKLSRTETELLYDLRGSGCLAIWERRYHSGGIDALIPRNCAPAKKMTTNKTAKPSTPMKVEEQRTHEDLLAEVNYLRMENAYLKKLRALVQQQAQAASLKKRK